MKSVISIEKLVCQNCQAPLPERADKPLPDKTCEYCGTSHRWTFDDNDDIVPVIVKTNVYQAVVAGDGAVVQGVSQTVVGARGVYVEGNVHGDIITGS